MCTFEAPSIAIVISHIRMVHSSDPNFRVPCGIGGCSTTSTSFSALYFHVYHHHQDVIKKRNSHSSTTSDNETTSCVWQIQTAITSSESNDLNDRYFLKYLTFACRHVLDLCDILVFCID